MSLRKIVADVGVVALTFSLPFTSCLGDRIASAATVSGSGSIDRSVFERQDLLYGTEIGAWDLDGGVAVHNPVARQHVMAAKTRLIRWGAWKKFDYLQQGQKESMSLAQFDMALDGIRSLGAIPLIKLPPIWGPQCDGQEDYWNYEWLEEIVRRAGRRVQLYEFGNEPEKQCNWDAATYARHWNDVVPRLKKFARSQGYEIYVGGPAMATSYVQSLDYMEKFLTPVRDAYVASQDEDYIPDFVSMHMYPNRTEDPELQDILKRITYWGGVLDQARWMVDEVWTGLEDRAGDAIGPRIKLAVSEYNYTIENGDTRGNDPEFASPYLTAMLEMLRDHDVWAANFFTIASHESGALDLLEEDGTPKPLYYAFKEMSTTDPLNTAPPAVDAIVTTRQKHPDGKQISSPALSTSQPGDVLYAFVASSGDPDQYISSVSGGGLTWQRVTRANGSPGTAEIWRTVSPGVLHDVVVTATRGASSSVGSLTVVAFAGADAAIGASAHASGSSGEPAVTITTTKPNSIVWGVANDWDGASPRTPGDGQIVVDQYLEPIWGDTYWVQRFWASVQEAGSDVTLDDITPHDHRWNYSAVEILPAN